MTKFLTCLLGAGVLANVNSAAAKLVWVAICMVCWSDGSVANTVYWSAATVCWMSSSTDMADMLEGCTDLCPRLKSWGTGLTAVQWLV